MALVQRNGPTVGTYTYNAFGQRTGKDASFPLSVSQRYGYDEGSRLLDEYGTSNRDYVWMDDLPIAVVDETVSGGITTSTVSYVHADGLGTPRAVADGSGTVTWQWAYQGNPLGEQLPTSSTGYVLNLRYLGQYYDAESKTNYNVFRDYEPATGRYLQNDPIGLGGGMSTYAYVGNDPLNFIDSLGLQTNLNLFPKGSSQWQGANNYPSTPGVYTVAAHGNPLMIVDAQGNPILPQDLANMIKHDRNFKPGEPVSLLSCNTGVTPQKPWYPTSYAQFLANDLGGSTVSAPNNFIWFNDVTGKTIVAGARDANGPVDWTKTSILAGGITMDLGNPGLMIQFTPNNK